MPSQQKTSPSTTPSLPPFVAANQKLFQFGVQLQANALKAAMRYQINALSFLKRRYEADAKLMDDLADAKEFNDVVDVVNDFVRNATSEYTAEASKLASIGSGVSQKQRNSHATKHAT